jgi:catechol 2,3-dioxygenase-like lactoylglutathione lyase family enzyme
VPTAPQIVQLALCTSDPAATVQRYTEALGFADAGGRLFWGEHISRLQELDEPDARCLVWWLVGRQDFFQLELFQHTNPPQRPLPADWRPSDLGWVRFGVAVPDFDAATRALVATGVTLPHDPVCTGGLRRVCFRDPEIGVIVEVMEDGPAIAGGLRPRFYDLEPAVVYVTVSVGDLQRARTFFVDVVGLVEAPEVTLHAPGDEALWGLPGARRETLVLRAHDIFLELVRYDDPPARPSDRRLSDQGIMNIAVGHRDRASVERLHDRIAAAGHRIAAPLPTPPAGATYLRDDQGTSLEILGVPREFDANYGFVPVPTFQVDPRWPQPRTPGP